jgi:predicted Zn-dependent peptidase
MQVSMKDLRRVAEQYLTPDTASTAIVSNEATIEANADLNLEICKL